jgi:hypothetical protein
MRGWTEVEIGEWSRSENDCEIAGGSENKETKVWSTKSPTGPLICTTIAGKQQLFCMLAFFWCG